MLKKIKLSNFKAWPDIEVNLASITGIFGANSSGKSSLIQFLLMLKHTKNSVDNNLVIDFGSDGKLINLGSYGDIVHLKNKEREISWDISWKLPETLKITDPDKHQKAFLFSGDEISLSSEIFLDKDALKARYIEYVFCGYPFRLTQKPGTGKFLLTPSKNSPLSNGFSFTRTKGRAWELSTPVKTYRFPSGAHTYYRNSTFLSDFEAAYEKLMDSIYYLGPLREYPSREYGWSGASPTDVGLRGEKFVDAILAATERGETRQRSKGGKYIPFQQIIAYWLKEIGLISDFRVQEIANGSNLYRVFVKTSPETPEVLITDVGFGVSQFLPVLVLLYYIPEGSVVILEQPEIHLHPSVQTRLADILVSVSKTRHLQIIVESHSEHLLNRLRLNVAREIIHPDDIKLYFCSTTQDRSKIEFLGVDLFGQISNWPKNFFGDSFSEIANIQLAALKRQTS